MKFIVLICWEVSQSLLFPVDHESSIHLLAETTESAFELENVIKEDEIGITTMQSSCQFLIIGIHASGDECTDME